MGLVPEPSDLKPFLYSLTLFHSDKRSHLAELTLKLQNSGARLKLSDHTLRCELLGRLPHYHNSPTFGDGVCPETGQYQLDSTRESAQIGLVISDIRYTALMRN